ncbi:hypothetical protein [Rhodococcus sp. WAY2]|uniref:hypothetical protein n=1 Tax=Rhodococcus sp. WAY2 TaxID=2663121 RepID=UPI00131F56ED|nr:hypothetical protein [Rhodococcus sp. WAY2]QHE73290.1 putative transposase for insertion sequence element IS1533 [Rhodococcus sp. WAY2]
MSRTRDGGLIPGLINATLERGLGQLLATQLQGVPKTLVWDGEGAVGRWRARQSELMLDCQGFRSVLGAKVYICKPADP